MRTYEIVWVENADVAGCYRDGWEAISTFRQFVDAHPQHHGDIALIEFEDGRRIGAPVY